MRRESSPMCGNIRQLIRQVAPASRRNCSTAVRRDILRLVMSKAPRPHEFALQFEGMIRELRWGETVLGRGHACEIVLPSPKASRMHAKFIVHESGVSLEDLASTNGVYVNDERIGRRRALKVGDRIQIGDTHFVLVRADQERDEGFPVAIRSARPSGSGARSERFADDDQSTRQAHLLETVGEVGKKMLALGRAAEAERLLGTHLERTLQEALEGIPLDPAVTDLFAELSVQLARANANPAPIERTFRLHTALVRLLPVPVVDQLYVSLRTIRGVRRSTLDEYIERLTERVSSFGPNERFVLKRIEGLSSLVSA